MMASSLSPPPNKVTMGMDFTPSPSFCVTTLIFGFLKSLNLHSVGLSLDGLTHLLPFVNPIRPVINKPQRVTGKEMVVYD